MPSQILPPKRRQNQFLTFALITVLVLGVLYYLNEPQRQQDQDLTNAKSVNISDITSGYATHAFDHILIRGNNIYAKTHSGSYVRSYKESPDTVSDLGWNDPKNPTKVEVDNIELKNFFQAHLGDLIFFLLIIGGAMWVFRSIARSQSTALSFGKSRARIADARDVKTTFRDVAGCDEAKNDLQEIVDFLKNPRKYTVIGAKIPRGALLVGAPGTGKTLLARAVAGEAGVPFFSISGSEFVEMFVGVGASRVRDLFLKAKRNAPCIIFIDEIDAVGRQRGGAGFGGGHDEREQTLNQILTEMDGFDKDTNVIVMAATNRPDVLDSALLRPGRFDRRIFIDKPDLIAREQILEVHSRNKKMSAKDIDLKTIAKQTVGLAGADLENIMNEAAIYAAKRGQKVIHQQDIVDAVEKVTIGAEKKSRKLNDKEKNITAYHEMGHAIVGHLCPESDPLHKISIVSRGFALGVTWFLPKEDQYTTSKKKFLDEICGLLGGRAAEELIFGEITTGASNDIQRASAIARNMAMRYGMAEGLGLVQYGEEHGSPIVGVEMGMTRNYSEEVARKIDDYVLRTIDEQYRRAQGILQTHEKKMHELTAILLKDETMSVETFIEHFDGPKAAEGKKKEAAKRKAA